MNKDIKIDFVRVKEISDTKSFAIYLRSIAKRSDEIRTEEMDGNPYRLTEFSDTDGIITGDIIKVRMDSIPVKAKATEGKGIELDLDDDEGIGEETAFLYHEKSRILVVQRNRYGTSISRLLTYVQWQIDDENAVFDTEIIPDHEMRLKFSSAKQLRKLSVAIADPNQSAKITAVEAINDTPPAAPLLNISMSMGHYEGGIDLDKAKQFVQSLFAWNSGKDCLRKVEAVAICDEDDHRAVLDLLKERMIEHETIALNANRHASYRERSNAVKRSFTRKKSELKSMFKWTE